MGERTFEDVKEYVEWQFEEKTKVLSTKPEQKFTDFGTEVTVWNVKTDNEGDWWVVEGDIVPMNLYTQSAHYFGTDEVYSFHMGLMERLKIRDEKYNPEDFVEGVTLGAEITPQIFRKLKNLATLIDTAEETEDFQSIGVQSRETLIELGNYFYLEVMAGTSEQPQRSNFKKKAELFVSFYLEGSDNSDYRGIIKKLTDSTWNYANKLTHSSNATKYEASTCIMLITSLVGVYENIMQKVYDPVSQYMCLSCHSKRLMIDSDDSDENGLVEVLYLKCEECSDITKVVFESNDDDSYTKGKTIK